MCCVGLRERHKYAVNSASVESVWVRTALKVSSRDKQQFQGTIIILRNCIHIQFWEMEDTNEVIFCLIFSIFCL